MWKYAFLLVAFVAQPALADGYDSPEKIDSGEETKMSGLRAEVRIGYETPTISGDDQVYKIGNAASFGAELGFDAPISRTMTLGAYANYEYAKVKSCDSGYCLGSNGNIQAGLRLGVNLNERSQLYVKAGYDSMKLKVSIPGFSSTKTLEGPQGAIGVDFILSRKMYAGMEIDYADLGSVNGINFQRRHIAAKLGTHF